jgi:hypothetical protein
MTEHRPDCRWPQYAKALLRGSVSRANRERVSCICKELLACEARVTALATPETVMQANYWYEQGQRDERDAAVQRVEALWSIDPSWDGTNWNNALHAAIAAVRGDQP